MATVTHTSSSKIELDKRRFADCEAYAQFALSAPRTAVVFVHGWGGSAQGTWKKFPAIVQEGQVKKFAKADFYYFGYDSWYTRAADSGDQLGTFLDLVMDSPRKLLEPTIQSFLGRSGSFRYDRLVVAAHSLGAIVLRYALIEAEHRHAAWFGRTRLVLFAPAHMGARARDLALATLNPIQGLRVVVGAFRYFVLTVDDLQPGGKVINDIQDKTKKILKRQPACCLKADFVVHGKYERVVITDTFVKDPERFKPVPARSHMYVPSPNSGYTLPVEIMEAVV